MCLFPESVYFCDNVTPTAYNKLFMHLLYHKCTRKHTLHTTTTLLQAGIDFQTNHADDQINSLNAIAVLISESEPNVLSKDTSELITHRLLKSLGRRGEPMSDSSTDNSE